MSETKPRIVVSHATFNTDGSVRDFRSQNISLGDEEYDEPKAAQTGAHTDKRVKHTWLRSATSWAPELVWCLLSVVLLMGLVMVLSTFDERPLPDLPLGLTLNTIVAVLATASRAVTVFLISQGISQMKWNQYVGRGRPLKNLLVFDEASRGPWGSLLMVVRTRGNILAFLASFLIISSLASSTLTQSAIAYTPRLVAEETLKATAQYCDAYPCSDSLGQTVANPDPWVDKLEAAAFGAVFTDVNRKLALLAPQCQSAECRWPEFDTLGVCFEMQNITGHLNMNISENDNGFFTRQVNTASLMDGKIRLREEDQFDQHRGTEAVNITVLVADSAIPLTGDGFDFPYPRESIGFKDQKQLLDTTLSHLVVVFNNVHADFKDADRKYRAVEILIHFCVQTLNVAVDQGEASTKPVKTHTHISEVYEGTMSIGFEDKGEAWHYEMSSADEKSKYKIFEYGDLDVNFHRAFNGFYTADRTANESQTGQMTRQLGLKMFRDLDITTLAEEADKKVWDNLESTFGTLATGMTNFMREFSQATNGTALISVTFVEVRWEWLTLVAAQVVLSIVFLLTVVVGTARLGVDVVKSSNMAELFAMNNFMTRSAPYEKSKCCYGKPTGDESRAQGIVYEGIKTEVGKDIEATLRKGDEGWRLEVKPKEIGV